MVRKKANTFHSNYTNQFSVNPNNGQEKNTKNSDKPRLKYPSPPLYETPVKDPLFPPTLSITFPPKEIWSNHICLYLSRKEIGSLRLICRWFRFKVLDKLWTQWIPYEQIKFYKSYYAPLGWDEPKIYGVYLTSKTPKAMVPLHILPPTSVELDFTAFNSPTHHESLYYLPEHVNRLILKWKTYSTPMVKNVLDLFPNLIVEFNDEGKMYHLLYWASFFNYVEIVRYIYETKRASHFVNDLCGTYGASSLYIACQQGHLDIAEMLLHLGANPNLPRMHMKATPLMIASHKNHREIVSLLLKHGVNVNQQDNFGKTALSYANEKGLNDIIQLLQNGLPQNTAQV